MSGRKGAGGEAAAEVGGARGRRTVTSAVGGRWSVVGPEGWVESAIGKRREVGAVDARWQLNSTEPG